MREGFETFLTALQNNFIDEHHYCDTDFIRFNNSPTLKKNCICNITIIALEGLIISFSVYLTKLLLFIPFLCFVVEIINN